MGRVFLSIKGFKPNALTGLWIAAAVCLNLMASAQAASPPASRMQLCAVQWNQMKAKGQANGVAYQVFNANCLKGGANVQSKTDNAIQPTKTVVTKTPSAPPMAMASKPAGQALIPSPQDRMKACASRWDQMKLQGRTKGMTYQQFSTTCLAGG
jgi:uncharacterized protein (DUF2237 family)